MLKFPIKTFRFLSFGRTPDAKQLKIQKVVGYMAVAFGVLLLLEIALGLA